MRKGYPMPLYEYKCPKCELRFEQLRSMSQCDEDAQCPQCHSSAQRVLSTFASLSKDGGSAGSCSSCSGSSCDSCHL